MDYKIDGNNLYINGQLVLAAAGEICDHMYDEFNHLITVIYYAYYLMPEKEKPIYYRSVSEDVLKIINQNVLCYNRDGDLVWTIEKTSPLPTDFVYFINEGSNAEGFWAYRRDAMEFFIDRKTGKILNCERGL